MRSILERGWLRAGAAGVAAATPTTTAMATTEAARGVLCAAMARQPSPSVVKGSLPCVAVLQARTSGLSTSSHQRWKLVGVVDSGARCSKVSIPRLYATHMSRLLAR